MLGIPGNDVSPAACTDLNNDGAITVTDAALMVNCYSSQAAHDQSPHLIHYHPWCDFPRGWLSTIDTVDLKVAALDLVNGYVDIHIKNPNCRVLGYEFELSGLTIQNVENLAPSLQNDISVTSSLGGVKVIGLSYLDTTLAKNTSWVPLVRVHYLALTGSQVCIAHITDVVNDQANNVVTHIVGPCITVPNTVVLDLKAFLEGPYVTGTGLMNDALRTSGLIPAGEPYTALGFPQAGGGGGEQVVPGVFDVTGANAIVDWVISAAQRREPFERGGHALCVVATRWRHRSHGWFFQRRVQRGTRKLLRCRATPEPFRGDDRFSGLLGHLANADRSACHGDRHMGRERTQDRWVGSCALGWQCRK
ncbi:MAG: hypothetical protein IPK99_03030 [Flavobacteriales bacterium]|nr:hypothetical protein [Flavobacteriales bacterium]